MIRQQCHCYPIILTGFQNKMLRTKNNNRGYISGQKNKKNKNVGQVLTKTFHVGQQPNILSFIVISDFRQKYSTSPILAIFGKAVHKYQGDCFQSLKTKYHAL